MVVASCSVSGELSEIVFFEKSAAVKWTTKTGSAVLGYSKLQHFVQSAIYVSLIVAQNDVFLHLDRRVGRASGHVRLSGVLFCWSADWSRLPRMGSPNVAWRQVCAPARSASLSRGSRSRPVEGNRAAGSALRSVWAMACSFCRPIFGFQTVGLQTGCRRLKKCRGEPLLNRHPSVI